MLQSCLLRKDFDFHRNSRPTVPMYADRRELLGFRDFFSSLPACRKGFFDTLKNGCAEVHPFFCIPGSSLFPVFCVFCLFLQNFHKNITKLL